MKEEQAFSNPEIIKITARLLDGNEAPALFALRQQGLIITIFSITGYKQLVQEIQVRVIT